MIMINICNLIWFENLIIKLNPLSFIPENQQSKMILDLPLKLDRRCYYRLHHFWHSLLDSRKNTIHILHLNFIRIQTILKLIFISDEEEISLITHHSSQSNQMISSTDWKDFQILPIPKLDSKIEREFQTNISIADDKFVSIHWIPLQSSMGYRIQ